MRALSLCVSMALAPCVHATGLAPQDFAYGFPIVLSSEASAYRIALPLAIYQGTVRDDLGDVGVFNSRGEAVPFFIRPRTDTPEPQSPESLPLFPLLGAAPATAAEMRVTLASPGLALHLQSGPSDPGTAVAHQYILDARAHERAVRALQLVWASTSNEFSGRLRIEASDDLDSWRTIVPAAPVANLHAGGQELINNRIDLASTQAKYWRLSWIGAPPTFPLTGVMADFAQSARPEWSSRAVDAREDPKQPRDLLFDLGGHIPIERVDLRLAHPNSVEVAELFSRKRPADPWHLVTRERFYRVSVAGGEQHNEAIDIPLNQDRYWLARLPADSSIPSGDVTLVAGWRASELVFLAHGSPPFLLAYGSGSYAAARMDLTPLITSMTVAPATLAKRSLLGGADRLSAAIPPVEWRRWILWMILVVAALGLAFMAKRLLSEHESNPTP